MSDDLESLLAEVASPALLESLLAEIAAMPVPDSTPETIEEATQRIQANYDRHLAARQAPKRERPFCQAVTKQGAPCRARAALGSPLCLLHSKMGRLLDDSSSPT